MARKRRRAEQELPFVALIDTMTNVVGVLVIVMVMIGISLARIANRVFSELPPATPAQIGATQAQLDHLRSAQMPLQDKLKALAGSQLTPAQTATLDAELARLEKQNKAAPVNPLDAANLELARYAAELQQKKTAANQMLAERDRLKAVLDKTPEVKSPPAKVVRIPAARPIPKDSKIEHILVTKDGAYWLDFSGAQTAFLNEFNFMHGMEQSKVKRGNQTVVIYDYQKLADYFATRQLLFREFNLDMTCVTWTSCPILKMTPRGPPTVPIFSALQRIKFMPMTVAMFHVTADGFENYLAAREICDKEGVPAGWDFANTPAYQNVVPAIETNRARETPKAAPAGDIKAPATKLD